MGHNVKNAVVTVPAYFNDSQRQVSAVLSFFNFVCLIIHYWQTLVTESHFVTSYAFAIDSPTGALSSLSTLISVFVSGCV